MNFLKSAAYRGPGGPTKPGILTETKKNGGELHAPPLSMINVRIPGLAKPPRPREARIFYKMYDPSQITVMAWVPEGSLA